MTTVSSKSEIKKQQIVLVVEDEVLVRMAIAKFLRDCGYKVIEAANADEAMVVLQRLETKLDIVFSDIEMPGSIGGFALSKWVREHRPDLQVMLAGTVTRAVKAATSLCEEGPVAKPYNPAAFHPHIRRLLASRQRPKSD